MHIVNIKPLSLNHAYHGKRYATQELKDFKELLGYILPKIVVPSGKLEVWYEFGVSSKGADGDNCQKCFQDALGTQYGFNDRVIYEWHGKKVDVKVGEEYAAFEIKKML